MNYNLTRFSISKLSTFIACPYHFYLSYVLKRSPERESDYAKIGKCLHSILECINRDMVQGLFLQADNYLQLIKNKVVEYQITPIYTLKFPIYVAEYINKLFSVLRGTQIIGIEKNFSVRFPTATKEYIFSGIIDLVLFFDGAVHIYDFKTKLKETPDLNIMLTRDLQVQGYSWAVHRKGFLRRGTVPELDFMDGAGLPVARYGHIQFIDKDQTSSVIYNDIFHYEELFQRFSYWLGRIEDCITQGYFPRNPSYCTYCEHKNFCLNHRQGSIM